MRRTTASCTPAISLRVFLFRSLAGPPCCEPTHVQDPRWTLLSLRLPSLVGPFSPAIWRTCGLLPGMHQASPSRRSEPPALRRDYHDWGRLGNTREHLPPGTGHEGCRLPLSVGKVAFAPVSVRNGTTWPKISPMAWPARHAW